MSMGEDGAPVPFPPFPLPPGLLGLVGPAQTNIYPNRKRLGTNFLINFMCVYFNIFVLTTSPLSETTFTT